VFQFSDFEISIFSGDSVTSQPDRLENATSTLSPVEESESIPTTKDVQLDATVETPAESGNGPQSQEKENREEKETTEEKEQGGGENKTNGVRHFI
jgi:hypothetical protein